MKKLRRIRWSGDSDRYFGPFTYCRDRASDKWHFSFLVYSTGVEDDDDDESYCNLRISGFGYTVLSPLPAIAKPFREKVYAKGWDAATVARLGRDWYWSYIRRSYGFSYHDGYLQVYLGLDSDGDKSQRWSWFVPWKDWRFVRHSLYDLTGNHFWTETDRRDWDASRLAKKSCPSAAFDFFDYDGELITATTVIEEREWHFGTGKFKWLSWFRKAKVSRSLNIDFSKEVGSRKGSWKGGTVGHSIDIKPGELHEAAFRRYCAEHNLVFREPHRLWLKSPEELHGR